MDVYCVLNFKCLNKENDDRPERLKLETLHANTQILQPVLHF